MDGGAAHVGLLLLYLLGELALGMLVMGAVVIRWSFTE